MAAPRVLILIDTCAGWSRGILLGFAAAAQARGWTLLHYPAQTDLAWLLEHLGPDAVVCGPSLSGPWPAALRERVSLVVNADRTAEGVASVCLDEARVSELALGHLLSRGLRKVTAFRMDDAAFAVARTRGFGESAERRGVQLVPGWESPSGPAGNPTSIVAWLQGLPQPCGVFACCDTWARILSHYARIVGLRVPENLALVGVDNDPLECQIAAPPLSSVVVPWRSMGQRAAELVALGLSGEQIAGTRRLVEPMDLIVRRSSATLAIDDRVVAQAVSWIREHAQRRLTVPMIAKAVGAPRQRLERCFRAALGRTIMEEVRRAHVEVARQLLLTTDLSLVEVAKRSGFTNPALLSVTFAREVGMPPGTYRRRAGGVVSAESD